MKPYGRNKRVKDVKVKKEFWGVKREQLAEFLDSQTKEEMEKWLSMDRERMKPCTS